LTALASISGRLIELRCIPGLDPALEEYMVDGVRRTHHDIGAIDRVLGHR